MRVCNLTRMPPEHQRRYILWAYRRSDGVTVRAAALLGMHKVTLLRYVDSLGLRAEVAAKWPNVVRCALAATHATSHAAGAAG